MIPACDLNVDAFQRYLFKRDQFSLKCFLRWFNKQQVVLNSHEPAAWCGVCKFIFQCKDTTQIHRHSFKADDQREARFMRGSRMTCGRAHVLHNVVNRRECVASRVNNRITLRACETVRI